MFSHNNKVKWNNRFRLWQTNPAPVDSDGRDVEGRDYAGADQNRWEYLAAGLLNHVDKNGGRLLDIGCGGGYILNEGKIRGFNVFGIDLYREATDFAASKFKVKTRCVSLYDFNPKNKFDVIVLNHVLEHITQVDKFLKKIKRLIKNDGVLLLASPNYQSLMRIIFRDRWYGFRANQHVWQFTPATLKKLLADRGFSVKTFPSSLDYNPKNKVKNFIFRFLTVFAEKLNLGDQIILTARPAKKVRDS